MAGVKLMRYGAKRKGMRNIEITLPDGHKLCFPLRNGEGRLVELPQQNMKVDIGPEVSEAAPEPLPFDLEAAKRGEPLVTRNGRKVDELHHFTTEKTPHPICYVAGGEVGWIDTKGRAMYSREDDLFMAPKPKRTVWVNINKEPGAAGYLHAHAYYNLAEACEGAEREYRLVTAHPIEIDA